MRPSNFCTYPWNSLFNKSEHETVALNIMLILREINSWRRLSWNEYEKTRKKHGGFSLQEKKYFDEVIDYTVSEKEAKKFSPEWRKIK